MPAHDSVNELSPVPATSVAFITCISTLLTSRCIRIWTSRTFRPVCTFCSPMVPFSVPTNSRGKRFCVFLLYPEGALGRIPCKIQRRADRPPSITENVSRESHFPPGNRGGKSPPDTRNLGCQNLRRAGVISRHPPVFPRFFSPQLRSPIPAGTYFLSRQTADELLRFPFDQILVVVEGGHMVGVLKLHPFFVIAGEMVVDEPGVGGGNHMILRGDENQG